MCKELAAIVKERREYYYGFGLPGKHMAKTRLWLEEYAVEAWHAEWPFDAASTNFVHADIIKAADRNGELYRFCAATYKMPTILVGPAHLEKIPHRLVKRRSHVVIPERNCYASKDEIIVAIMKQINEANPELILFSCGLPAGIFIDAVYQEYRDCITLIDCGSMWDPYCGRNTRSAHAKSDYNERLRRNTSVPD